MKTNELKELGVEALQVKIAESRKELAALKLKFASKAEIEKPVRMRGMRREIARMLTVLKDLSKESK